MSVQRLLLRETTGSATGIVFTEPLDVSTPTGIKSRARTNHRSTGFGFDFHFINNSLRFHPQKGRNNPRICRHIRRMQVRDRVFSRRRQTRVRRYFDRIQVTSLIILVAAIAALVLQDLRRQTFKEKVRITY